MIYMIIHFDNNNYIENDYINDIKNKSTISLVYSFPHNTVWAGLWQHEQNFVCFVALF